MVLAMKTNQGHELQWRQRAAAWGVLPVARVRLPLPPPSAAGGPVAAGAHADPTGVATDEAVIAGDLDLTRALGRGPWVQEAETAEGPESLAAPPYAGVLERLEEEEAVEEEAVEAAPPPVEDAVARYLGEIGKAKLLTAAQEVALGKRIEAGQAQLRETLAAIPAAVVMLLGLAERVRAKTVPVDLLPDVETASPDTPVLRTDTATRVRRALSALTSRERDILKLRFGIETDHEHTLEEIGARLSLTRERIRQIESEALRKLGRVWAGRDLRALIEAS